MRIGFRTWTLQEANGEFAFNSVATGYTWKILGANQAANYRDPISYSPSFPSLSCQPSRSNMAGLYHFYDPKRAEDEYAGRGLIGACMCWGRIGGKDGERMFRAEYAQILAVTEPHWAKYAKPSRPIMPRTLTERMWMVSVNLARAQLLNTPASFRKYVESLATVLGIDPGTLDIPGMHKKFAEHKGSVDAEHERYLEAVAKWERDLVGWDQKRSDLFRAQMPFPVFSTIPELTAYAQKFGDLGPPDREVLPPLTGE